MAHREAVRGNLYQSPRSGREAAKTGAPTDMHPYPRGFHPPSWCETPEDELAALRAYRARARTQHGRKRGVSSDADTLGVIAFWSFIIGMVLIFMGAMELAAWIMAASALAGMFSVRVTR